MGKKEFLGEFTGTFLMVLFGCGAVAVSGLFHLYEGIFPIAVVWGLSICLGIYVTRSLSCAHFNPAVTIAMAVSGRMKMAKVPVYLGGQFLGALAAAALLYIFFAPSIASYEAAQMIVRGTPESMNTAKMFGEYYQLPGSAAVVSMPLAMLAEGFGTFILVLLIFCLTEGCNVGRPDNNLAPVFIGLTVSSLICLLAPLTQAGFNPARDFAPRLIAWAAGWGIYAFPDQSGGFFFVYMLSPVLGGLVAAALFHFVVEPLMKQKEKSCDCC